LNVRNSYICIFHNIFAFFLFFLGLFGGRIRAAFGRERHQHGADGGFLADLPPFVIVNPVLFMQEGDTGFGAPIARDEKCDVIDVARVVAALAGKVQKGLIARLMVADVIMIVTGFLGEISAPGEVATYIWFIISCLAWIWIIVEVFSLKATGKGYAAKAVNTMKWFVIIGWSIYPLGTAIQQFMSVGKVDGDSIATAGLIAAIIYIIADLTNKVIFGIVAVRAAKNS
jgi:hypothetical protein